GVEPVGRVRAAGKIVAGTDAVRAGVAGAVNRAVDRGRLLADVLHDVDLAARRPADRADVVTEHPDRRPVPLPFGKLRAHLDASVCDVELVASDEPRRRVLAGAVPALKAARAVGRRLDDQPALLDARVRRLCRVVLVL